MSYRTVADHVNALRYRRSARGEEVKQATSSALHRMMRSVGRSSWDRDQLFDVLAVLEVPPERLEHWRQAFAAVAGPADPASIVEATAGLPAESTDFTGRSPLVGELLARAVPEVQPDHGVVFALVGMAGVGKTQLALHVAHELVRAGHFDEFRLHVDLRGFDLDSRPPADPAAVLDQLLRRLGVRGHLPEALEVKARSYRNQVHGRRVLLILDDAWSPDQVRDLLPGTRSSLTIITSRHAMAELSGVTSFDVEPLDDADAIALLRRTAGLDVTDEVQDAALTTIAHQCGNLPQALAVIGRHSSTHPDWTLDDHVAVLEELVLHEGVDAALRLSYDGLPTPQQRLLRLLSTSPCAESTVHSCAALAGADPDVARELLTALVRAHLVQPLTAGRHKLHDLVRVYAHRRALITDPASTREAAMSGLAAHYAHNASVALGLVAPHEENRRPDMTDPGAVDVGIPDDSAARQWLDDERGNLLVIARHAVEAGRVDWTSDLAAVIARYLEISAHYRDAASLHELAARSGDPRRRCTALINLGIIDFRRARHTDAEGHYLEALRSARELGDVTVQGRVHINLGNVYAMLTDYPSALDHYQHGYDIASEAKTTPGDLANVLTNLGNTFERLGRYAEADDRNAAARTLYSDIGDRFGESIAEGNLGLVRQRVGDHANALVHHRRARELSRGIGDPQGEALACANIAHALISTSDLDGAEEALGQAEQVLDGVHDPLGRAFILHQRSRLFQARGRHPDALDANAAALESYREAGDRQAVAEALNIRAALRLLTGHPDEARQDRLDALELAKSLGDRYEAYVALDGLSDVADAVGQRESAARFHHDAEIIRAELGVGTSG